MKTSTSAKRLTHCLILGMLVLLVLLLLGASCGQTPRATDNGTGDDMALADAQNTTEEPVGFMISRYHFVHNSYSGKTNPSYLLIRTYSSFASVFGVGAVMGMDYSKLITEEKLDSGFVMSIVYQGNDIRELGVEKVTLINGQLQVRYTSQVVSPDATWECNCHVTTLIDNCDFDSILLFQNGQPLPDAVITQL